MNERHVTVASADQKSGYQLEFYTNLQLRFVKTIPRNHAELVLNIDMWIATGQAPNDAHHVN